MGMAYNWKLILSVSICLIQAAYSSHVYIVYLGGVKNQDAVLAKRSHLRLLSAVFSSDEDAKQSLLYSYRLHISGFSAKLNSSQANTLSRMKCVVTVFRSTTLQLHTTRSWDFMDLTLAESQMMPIQLGYGKDVVVGIFDTGIWPELKSFQEDLGMRPLPLSWKGRCVEGEKFDPTIVCNHKLIGARYYVKGFEQEYGRLNTSCSANGEYLSARDCLGHGTHTASTAVGSIVDDASFTGGLGAGTARGGAPRARLAIYKVCWSKDLEGKCTEADILAAFDDALHDGVHIISASFGSAPPLPPFFASSASIGSFHAMQLGITVVFSAGNDGPDPSLVQNVAPWAICVGASSIDRAFPTEILLDQNITITGESLLTEQIKGRLVDARAYFTDGICRPENWNKRVAVGRIILCFSTIGMVSSDLAEAGVVLASGLGLIFVEPKSRHIADVSIIPTIWVDYAQGSQILNYLSQSPKLPKIQVAPSRTTIGKTPAPTIAYFSSKGPSSISPDILKPDISAPGVSILAAWPPEAPPTLYAKDGRSVRWNFQSGTSMSCPHVAGAAALVKSAHPHWSPSAIRSALMTTAYAKDKNSDNILVGGSMEESNPFDYGAGHMNPLKAMDPGLVYDLKPTDYVRFLCNIGYNDEQIRSIALFCPSLSTPSDPDNPPLISGRCSCPKASIASSQSNANLNYPSITVLNLQSTTTVKRTLRNVGQMKTALYFASVECPNGVGIHVWPRLLFFSSCGNEISFYVTLTPEKTSQGRYDFGEILWTDGFHFVRTPLIVLVNTSVFTTMDTL